MIAAICLECKQEFKTFPAWVRKGGGKHCSYRCMGDARKGRATYIRTPQQNAKMSLIKKAEDQTLNRARFLVINANKKGKTLEELYPDKAMQLREFHRQQTAEKNPNWRGGKTRNKYPYVFHRLRSTIIVRDAGKCQGCDMTDEEHKTTFLKGTGLTVHHIDYNKDNNDPSNLITLCVWCNSKANSRRKEWQIFYQSKLAG